MPFGQPRRGPQQLIDATEPKQKPSTTRELEQHERREREKKRKRRKKRKKKKTHSGRTALRTSLALPVHIRVGLRDGKLDCQPQKGTSIFVRSFVLFDSFDLGKNRVRCKVQLDFPFFFRSNFAEVSTYLHTTYIHTYLHTYTHHTYDTCILCQP